jgi:RimJ/RimL family protein N-acetyltransferase
VNITFIKASPEHLPLIMSWLNEPHMIEFWDNSQEHKDDIANFVHGRKQTYFGGAFTYWIGCLDGTPYALILSEELTKATEDLPELHYQHLSDSSITVGLDFGIGSPEHIGKGLAVPTLKAFMSFYKSRVPKVESFLIDPDSNNPRAVHVYEKAGFVSVGSYNPNQGAFVGSETTLMIKEAPRRGP